jgi:hypothetical protein
MRGLIAAFPNFVRGLSLSRCGHQLMAGHKASARGFPNRAPSPTLHDGSGGRLAPLLLSLLSCGGRHWHRLNMIGYVPQKCRDLARDGCGGDGCLLALGHQSPISRAHAGRVPHRSADMRSRLGHKDQSAAGVDRGPSAICAAQHERQHGGGVLIGSQPRSWCDTALPMAAHALSGAIPAVSSARRR